MNDYVLYIYPSCPYCRKVLRYMRQNDIDIETKNAYNAAAARELIAAGGKEQVPCLLINGKALYESDDIITYMQENMLQDQSGAGAGRSF